MIRATLALILIALSSGVHATTANDFVREFAQTSNLERAARAYEFCENTFALWPSPAYTQDIQSLGQTWLHSPEASYYLLSTCQTMWISRYLDPLKSTQLARHRNRAKLAYYISALDFISSYKFLREEIRLFSTVAPQAASNAPAAPYEILTGLASSERQLDETLHTEMKTAVTALAATAGTLFTALKATKAFTDFTVARSVQAGRIVRHAALVGIIAWGAGEIAEYKMWQVRHSELLGQVRSLAMRIADPRFENIRPVLLDEFFRASERLGHFYSYDVYLAESGGDVKAKATDEKCFSKTAAFFGGRVQSFEGDLFTGKGCRDAATTWTGAAQFVERVLPGSAEARMIKDRLMAHAKRAYWRFEETKAYEESLPVCTPDLKASTILNFKLECRDRATGALTI